jgi:hypothetical protein
MVELSDTDLAKLECIVSHLADKVQASLFAAQGLARSAKSRGNVPDDIALCVNCAISSASNVQDLIAVLQPILDQAKLERSGGLIKRA